MASDAKRNNYAYNDGIKTLFKFMRYPPGSGREHVEYRRRVEALLSEGELYFPLMSELNDPFEAAPLLRIRELPEDELQTQLSKGAHETLGRIGFNQEQLAKAEKAIASTIETGQISAHVAASQVKWRHIFRSKIPICCFSSTRASTLLWSYYAEGHTGICIHFDATAVPFGAAQRVVYSDRYPEIVVPRRDNDAELVELALLTKSAVWNHEREYRSINYPKDYSGGPTAHALDEILRWKRPRLALIPPALITGVTVGASTPHAQIEDVLRICHNRPVRIPVYQATCGADRFELDFTQLSRT